MSRGWILYWTVVVVGTIALVVGLAPPGGVEALGKLISSVAPIVTVGLAIFGLVVWRVQLVAKRYFEIAEESLAATIGAVRALSSIRNPFSFGNEGQSRPAQEGETKEQKERRDQAYVSYERAKHLEGTFVSLEKWALVCEAHFGAQVADDMRSLIAARNRVVNASFTVHGLEGSERNSDSMWKMINKLHAVMYESGITDAEEPTMNDVLSGEIAQARQRIVDTLKPYLAEPRLNTLLRPS